MARDWRESRSERPRCSEGLRGVFSLHANTLRPAMQHLAGSSAGLRPVLFHSRQGPFLRVCRRSVKESRVLQGAHGCFEYCRSSALASEAIRRKARHQSCFRSRDRESFSRYLALTAKGSRGQHIFTREGSSVTTATIRSNDISRCARAIVARPSASTNVMGRYSSRFNA